MYVQLRHDAPFVAQSRRSTRGPEVNIETTHFFKPDAGYRADYWVSLHSLHLLGETMLEAELKEELRKVVVQNPGFGTRNGNTDGSAQANLIYSFMFRENLIVEVQL